MYSNLNYQESDSQNLNYQNTYDIENSSRRSSVNTVTLVEDLEKVKQKRYQLIDIQPGDFNTAKELFDILRVPYLIAPWEAEKMCSKLCIDGLVEAVLSEDTDVIAYGAPIFLTKIDTSTDTGVEIKNSEIKSVLNFTQEQLLDLCIMCGTDYNPNIFRVGAHTAYKKITAFKSIDGLKNNTTLDIGILNHERVRELFTKFENYSAKSIPYCGTPDYEKLLEFILKYKVWYDIRKNEDTNLTAVHSRLEKLKNDFTLSIMVFEDDEKEEITK